MRGRPGRYNVPDVMRGPTIHFDRPRQDPPPLASLVSRLGPPFCGRVQSLCDGCRGSF
jgi:hypothetical protein